MMLRDQHRHSQHPMMFSRAVVYAVAVCVLALVAEWQILPQTLVLAQNTALNQPVKVSHLPGGIEDPLHFHPNCSCFDRHQVHILMVADVLQISYYYAGLVAGAQRAARDMGAELYIQPAPVLSTSQMAQTIQSSLSTRLFTYFNGPPDVIISALPGATTLDEPLATLLSTYQTAHIPFASIHSGNINQTMSLGDSDSGFLYHIAADNQLLGQTAASELIARVGAANFTSIAFCFTDLLTNEASISRCAGFQAGLAPLGINVQVFEVNTITQSPTPVYFSLVNNMQGGKFIPVLSIDAECTAVLLSALTEFETNWQQSSAHLAAIAAVDVSPVTAQALRAGQIVVAFDQQPFFTGYLSVALAAQYVRTSTYPSNRYYSSGPILVDKNTPLLVEHANAEAGGFPECNAVIVTNCFNRSAVFLESSHHLVASDVFGSNIRSGLYQATVDLAVAESDLVQPTKVNGNNVVQIQNLAALVAAHNLSLSGVIAVPRNVPIPIPAFQQLSNMQVPVITINNGYSANMWPNGPGQPIAHVGTDAVAFGYSIAQRFIALKACKILTVLDPDGTYIYAPLYTTIVSTVQAAGITGNIRPATSSNQDLAAQQITSYLQNGTNCIMSSSSDSLLTVMKNLGVYDMPGVHVGLQDSTPLSISLVASGRVEFTVLQNEYFQGYLPVLLITLMQMTGGGLRGNHAVKTRYTYESTYSYANGYTFPYIETGPQAVTKNTKNILRLASCGTSFTGTFPASVALPTIYPITSYPFAMIEFPMCIDPPPTVYLSVVDPGTYQQMQIYAQCVANATLNAYSGTGSTSTCTNPFNATTSPIVNINYATVKGISNGLSVSSPYSDTPSGFLLAFLDFNYVLLSSDQIQNLIAATTTHSLTVYSQILAVTTNRSDDSRAASTLTVAQTGTTQAALGIASAANFSDLAIVSAPGTVVTLRFYLSLGDGRTVYSNAVSLEYQSCEPGYFISNNLCAPCPSGRSTFMKDATYCVQVPTSIPVSASVAIRILAGAVVCSVLGVMAVLVVKQNTRVVRSYSPLYCLISLCGLLMVLVSAILMVEPSPQPAQCTAATWLFNIGFSAAFSAVWAKTFRLWRIFGNPLLQMLAISNAQLIMVIGLFCGVDIVVLTAWSAVSPYNLSPSDSAYVSCVSSQADTFNFVLLGVKSAWIISGVWLNREIRRLAVPSRYNESDALSMAIYNVALIGSCTLGIWFGLRNSLGENNISILLATAAILATAAFGGLLFVPIVRQTLTKQSAKSPSTKTGSRLSGSRGGNNSGTVSGSMDDGEGSHDAIHVMLDLSEEFERVIRDIRAKAMIHPKEKLILELYKKLNVSRKKAFEMYSASKQTLAQIAKANADLVDLRRSGNDHERVSQVDGEGKAGVEERRGSTHSMQDNAKRGGDASTQSSTTHAVTSLGSPASMLRVHDGAANSAGELQLLAAHGRSSASRTPLSAPIFNAVGEAPLSTHPNTFTSV